MKVNTLKVGIEMDFPGGPGGYDSKLPAGSTGSILVKE